MSELPTADAPQTCSLSWPEQRLNLILFAVCTGTQYLAAPVLYVGITQASLCHHLGADTRTSNVTLERSGSDWVWSTLATLTRDGRGEVAYEDLDVRAGGRYGYRLRILTAQGAELAGETWVDIPSEARLSLGGAVPNPAIDRLVVSFALASAESATLDLLDIAGRRVIHRDVSAFGPGLHRVDLGSTYGLEAGIYLLRLSQGSGSQVRRISLLH